MWCSAFSSSRQWFKLRNTSAWPIGAVSASDARLDRLLTRNTASSWKRQSPLLPGREEVIASWIVRNFQSIDSQKTLSMRKLIALPYKTWRVLTSWRWVGVWAVGYRGVVGCRHMTHTWLIKVQPWGMHWVFTIILSRSWLMQWAYRVVYCIKEAITCDICPRRYNMYQTRYGLLVQWAYRVVYCIKEVITCDICPRRYNMYQTRYDLLLHRVHRVVHCIKEGITCDICPRQNNKYQTKIWFTCAASLSCCVLYKTGYNLWYLSETVSDKIWFTFAASLTCCVLDQRGYNLWYLSEAICVRQDRGYLCIEFSVLCTA